MITDISPTPRASRRARLLMAVVLALALLAQASYFQQTTSAVYDEGIYLTAGLDFYHHGRVERLFNSGIAPAPVILSYLPPALAFGEDRIRPVDFPRAILLARITHLIAVGLPLLLLPSLWMTRRRGLLAGLGVGVMLAFSPLVVAFSAIAVTDACFAVAFLLALATLDAHLRRPGTRSVARVGLAVGVALAAKYTAILLLPLAFATFLWTERPRTADRRPIGWLRGTATAVGQTIAVGACALLLVWVLHGFAVTRVLPDNSDPRCRGAIGEAIKTISRVMAPAPVRGIAFQIDHVCAGQDQFLLGQKSTRGWWYYYPLALLYKSTPAELLLAALLPLLLWMARRGLDETTALIAASAALMAASVLPSRLDIGVRFVLVLYPLVALLAVDCAAAIGRRVPWVPALLAVVAVMQVTSAIAAAPRYLSYFNRVFTPAGQAYTRLVDSNLDWGQDLPALRAALSERGTNRVLLAYFGVSPPQAYGIQATSWDTADDKAVGRQRWIAISATLMNGVYLTGDAFGEFAHLRPDARPSDSLFLYDTARLDVQQALAFTRFCVAIERCPPGAAAPRPSELSYGIISHWHVRCNEM